MKLKKFLLPAVLLLLIFQFAAAQNPVPNPSFENWTDGEPDNWSTSNQGDSIIVVTQTDTAHSGSYAVRGECVYNGNDIVPANVISEIFPVSQQYNYLNFYCWITPSTVSEFTAYVEMLDSNSNIVGLGNLSFNTSTDSFAFFSVPITYTGMPSACYIQFGLASDPNQGSAIYFLDDVELASTTGITEQKENLIQYIYPNPANHAAFIQLHSSIESKTTLILSDIMGREIGRSEISGQKSEIDISNFESGIYFIRLVSGHDTATEKLIVQH